MFKSIVVGTDGSATAGKAVRHAAELARRQGARLHVATAYEPLAGLRSAATSGAISGVVVVGTEDWSGRAVAEVDKILDEVSKSLGESIDFEMHRLEGDPADAIVGLAEDQGADLIVLGNKGMTGARRFLLGSVPNRVSHQAPCSVLIVHTT
jgi:nucleotide-binding universal stress UspA family protein